MPSSGFSCYQQRQPCRRSGFPCYQPRQPCGRRPCRCLGCPRCRLRHHPVRGGFVRATHTGCRGLAPQLHHNRTTVASQSRWLGMCQEGCGPDDHRFFPPICDNGFEIVRFLHSFAPDSSRGSQEREYARLAGAPGAASHCFVECRFCRSIGCASAARRSLSSRPVLPVRTLTIACRWPIEVLRTSE